MLFFIFTPVPVNDPFKTQTLRKSVILLITLSFSINLQTEDHLFSMENPFILNWTSKKSRHYNILLLFVLKFTSQRFAVVLLFNLFLECFIGQNKNHVQQYG